MPKLLVLLTLFAGLTGCVSTQLSSQQRRALQIRNFKNSNYNNVFRAFKTVLQDEGYIIKNQDMKGGLIVAHNTKPTSTSYVIFAAMVGDHNYQTGTNYEVSVNLEEVRKGFVESRVIIQQISTYKGGSVQGSEILQPELYRSIYSKVFTEVARRKAQGR